MVIGGVGLSDFYYFEYDTWESPFAVNYDYKARNWFVSHGIRLHYVTSREMILLGKIPVIEGNGKLIE